MMADTEFAPEYTQKEKIRYFVKVCAICLPMSFIMLYWFTPWFHNAMLTSTCVQAGEINGLNFILYGVFVGLPLLAGGLLFAILGPRLIKTINLGQHPLPGEKVLSKTAYIYGRDAKIRAYVLLGLLSSTLIVAVQGIFWAGELIYLLQYSAIKPC